MVELRAPLTAADIIKEVHYVVYLYEPSTEYRRLVSMVHYFRDAQRVAKAQVDDACKTEGWIYKKFGEVFLAMGYAWLQGDGEVVYKSIISDHVFLVQEATPGDGDVLLPGWYFADETEGSNGPFGTVEEANAALLKYAEWLEGGSNA